MNTANIIAGLTILSRNCPDGYGATAWHDGISHCAVRLSEAEVTELLALGWFRDGDEGWVAYV